MLRLLTHRDAEDDLDKLWERDEDAAATITVTLEQLRHDPDLLDRLSQQHYGRHGTAGFHVDGWITQWKRQRNLWRIKIWELHHQGAPYRVVYAFFPRNQIYYVLGITHREFDYDANHPTGRRIIDAYDALVQLGYC